MFEFVDKEIGFLYNFMKINLSFSKGILNDNEDDQIHHISQDDSYSNNIQENEDYNEYYDIDNENDM